jgi:poly-gamma-glutamate system protein
MKKLLFAIAFIAFILLIFSKSMIIDDDYHQMYDIAKSVEVAFEQIGDEKERLGILNGRLSILGPEYTGITTTLGSLESKTTAANPNFSSVIYKYIKSMDLEIGDSVAINVSGSFPSLNIQVIMVVEAMGYEPVIMSSIGASTHGATDPEFTFLDMENYLFKKGIIAHQSILFSPGGDGDMGRNMDQVVLAEIVERLKGLGYNYVAEENYFENVKNRVSLYGDVAAFINVGGNFVSLTGNDIGNFDGYGLLNGGYNIVDKGLIGYYLTREIPVLHLLNIKDIAIENSLPIDPGYPVVIGESGSFYREKFNFIWFVIMMSALSILLVVKVYDEKKRKQEYIRNIVKQKFVD